MANKDLLVEGVALVHLKIAVFCSLLLPFLLLVLSKILILFNESDFCILISINIHVVVEYVVAVALAFYIYSFRKDLSRFSIVGKLICKQCSDISSQGCMTSPYHETSEADSLLSSPLLCENNSH